MPCSPRRSSWSTAPPAWTSPRSASRAVVVRVEGRGSVLRRLHEAGLPGGGEAARAPGPGRFVARIDTSNVSAPSGVAGRARHAQRGTRDPGDAARSHGPALRHRRGPRRRQRGPADHRANLPPGPGWRRPTSPSAAGEPAPARLLIARDTRLSGPLLEHALVSGILSAGADALVAGVLPTPAIAFLIPALGAEGGAVLSASHNPFEDNGVKLFSGEGDKLPDAWEDEIEARLEADPDGPSPPAPGSGACAPSGAPRAAISTGSGRVCRRLRSDGREARARLRSRRDVPRGAAPLPLRSGRT